MRQTLSLSIALATTTMLLLAGCGEALEQDPEQDTADLVPRFEADGEGFYRMPWPSDMRLDEDGTLDLDDLPGQQTSLIARYVEVIGEIDGYSTTPVAYFPFDSQVDPGEESIPGATETVQPDSPLQLIDVSEQGCGERIPVEARYKETGDRYTHDHVLQIGAVPGFTLRQRTPYAFVITTGFGAPNDYTIDRPPAIQAALADDATGEMAEVYAPLRDCAEQAGLALDDIAIATVFTTQDATTATRKMREVVMSDATDTPSISDWREWEDATTTDVVAYRGTVDMPMFQEGTSPYQNTGGNLVFDADGMPEVQRWEAAPFSITVPRDVPSGPLPVIIWEDGTGADINSHVGDTHITRALLSGFAVLSFEPQFHGDRATSGSDEILSTFNYLNPASGRTSFRQQVAETSYMIRLIREQLDGHSDLPELDTERIMFGGHSQGAIVGAITAGVEPDIDAYYLNGVGGYLSETIVFRKDIVDVEALVKRFINLDADQDLDRFHLVVQLAQTGADATDPLNYASAWKGWEGHPDGSHVLMSNGKGDPTTSTRSMTALMTAGDVPAIGIAGWEVDPTGLRGDRAFTDNPASGNRTAESGRDLTFVSYTNKNTGHFTLYRDGRARNMALEFWKTALMGTPEVTY
ncbi:MAG: hypothetical protein ACQEVA_19535 [Myxococcota bacterium]